jgi:hypothetical protein
VSSQQIFQGIGVDGINGEGLDDLLLGLNADKDGVNLSNVIISQYEEIAEKMLAIDGPLSEAVDVDKEDVINAYNSLSEQVIYLKSDMPSVMCIPITYVDNPSDSD